MRNLYTYILTFVIISTAFYNQAQDSYFFNQRNIFTVNVSYNPRLVPILRSNSFDGNYYDETSLGMGTYYQRYNEDNVLVGGHKKHNLMLNLAYGRVFNRNKVIGLEFNYQKQRMTFNENSMSGYSSYYYEENPMPYVVSTPVFNIYDVQFTYGLFNSNHLAPNQHLISYGVGVRIFSLDKNENYRQDALTPFTDLSDFLSDYEKNFVFARLSLNYTYRILLTKNLSFDLGVNTNITLTTEFDPYTGNPSGYNYANNKKVAYSREYIKSRLGHYSFFNIFYFRTGLTFAI